MDTVKITIGAVEFDITSPDAGAVLSQLFRNRDDVICVNTEFNIVYYIAGARFAIAKY